ncbi:MAG: polysaccharide deacetylase family protein [Armatimonadetes bacterium]|nr:polysaccharide deacetylase family protein [Armatimonadota bacterium]
MISDIATLVEVIHDTTQQTRNRGMSSPSPIVTTATKECESVTQKPLPLSAKSAYFTLLLFGVVASPAAGLQGENLIRNPSVEVANPDDPEVPQYWFHASSGNNSHTFTYDTDGYKSPRSIKVNVSDYSSGFVFWSPYSVRVTGGRFYTFSAHVKGDVEAQTLIRNEWSLGTGYYGGGDTYSLKRAIPAGDWTKYTETFFVPAGVESVRIFFGVDAEGTFSSDNFSLVDTPYTTNPNRTPMVTIMADDVWLNFKSNAIPIMDQHGFKSTFYINTNAIGGTGMMTTQDLRYLREHGHEMAAHAVHHVNLRTLDIDSLHREIADSVAYLNQVLIGDDFVHSFATPLGGHNKVVDTALREHDFNGLGQSTFGSNRNTEGFFNYPENFQPLNVRTFMMKDTVTDAQFRDLLILARDHGLWLTLTYHQVKPITRPSGSTTTSTDQFRSQMQMISNLGIRVVTVSEGLKRFAKGE